MSLLREALAKQRDHVVRVRIAAEHGLREHELPVGVDVEDAVRAGNHLDNGERVLPLLQDPRRQTGGVRQCPSGDAVLDPDAVIVHRSDSSTRALGIDALFVLGFGVSLAEGGAEP